MLIKWMVLKCWILAQLQSEWIEACDKSEKLIVNMFRYMHQHIPSGKLT